VNARSISEELSSLCRIFQNRKLIIYIPNSLMLCTIVLGFDFFFIYFVRRRVVLFQLGSKGKKGRDRGGAGRRRKERRKLLVKLYNIS